MMIWIRSVVLSAKHIISSFNTVFIGNKLVGYAKVCNNNRFHKLFNLWYAIVLTSLLSPSPAGWKNIEPQENNLQKVEVIDKQNILDNIERRTWVKLPNIYVNFVQNFISTNRVLKDTLNARFTEDFIVEQMKNNWWINKQNQLLFVWDAIYEQITKANFYEWEDGDEQRLNEFEHALDYIEACWKKYKHDMHVYLKQRIAEARQQSADYDRRIAEARQQSAEAIKKTMRLDSMWIKRMVEFYEIYTRNPNVVKQEEIDFSKEATKKVIAQCKKYWIDYRAILLKEVWWDQRKVDAILKFYGVE